MLALRNTKISRDIATTCHNVLYGKPDFTPFANKRRENAQKKFPNDDYRYIVSNTSKPADLPKFDFPPEEPQRQLLSEMRHLQPASQSKFISADSDYNPLRAYEPRKEHSFNALKMPPFPRPIIEPQHNAMTFSEISKLKPLHVKGMTKTSTRSYSTSPFLMVAEGFIRGFATKKKGDDETCDKKKKCRKMEKCPHFIPKECEASKGSKCDHYYIDPKCTKKMAPYKSYSETCHELLEDDPSECFQCPWQKCRGIESIKPPKKNYHTWRNYSTCKRPSNEATLSTTYSNDVLQIPPKECYRKKKPCKAPPPKCGKKEKTKKCPPLIKDKKKKCTAGGYWTEAYGLWADKEHIVPSPPWVVASGLNNVPMENPVSQLPVNAHPTNCKCNKCDVGIIEKIVYEMKDKDCPADKEICPPAELPLPPVVDRSIDDRFLERDPCCRRAKRERTVRKRRRERPRVFVPEPRDHRDFPDHDHQ